MFKIMTFFTIIIFVQLYVRVSILLTCGKRLHDRIISLREQVWAHTTSLIPHLFIEVHFPSEEGEWSCICVFGVSDNLFL